MRRADSIKVTWLLGMTLAGPAAAQQKTGEEVLLKAEPKTKSIEFRVKSGGCTKKNHFGVETLAMKPLTVRLVRLRPDYCEATLNGGQSIEFSYSELGAPTQITAEEAQQVVVVNTLASP